MPDAKAAIFHGPGKAFSITDRALPASLADGEVLIAIDLATICGSDLHTVGGRRVEPTPCVLGHEGVGRIVAVGVRRADWRAGERVTWTLTDSCGACPACADFDLPQKCARLFKYGHAGLEDGTGLNGCYASHIVLRTGTHLVRVPDSLSDAVAAPANCALATMVAATESLPRPCRLAVVQGAGLLGLYGCALLRAKGVPRVIVVDTEFKRLEWVAEFGGEPALGTATEHIRPGEADAVFEVAGTPAVVTEGVQLLRSGGFYAFVGMVHPESALNITGEAVIRRCLTIRGFHNYAPRHLDAAIAFLSQQKETHPWAELVSPPRPLARLNEAFAEAESRRWHRVSVSPLG